jgi:hypothetical protein
MNHDKKEDDDSERELPSGRWSVSKSHCGWQPRVMVLEAVTRARCGAQVHAVWSVPERHSKMLAAATQAHLRNAASRQVRSTGSAGKVVGCQSLQQSYPKSFQSGPQCTDCVGVEQAP